MILRRAIDLQPGDTMLLKHDRYKVMEFVVVEKINSVKKFETLNGHTTIPIVKIVSTGKLSSFGPTIEFRLNDMVSVTAE